MQLMGPCRWLFVVAFSEFISAAFCQRAHADIGAPQASVEQFGAVRIGQLPMDIVHSGAATKHTKINLLSGRGVENINILAIGRFDNRSEEHMPELQSPCKLVCR